MQKLLESSVFLLVVRSQFVLLLALATYLSLSTSSGVVSVNIWDKALHFIGWAGLYGSLQLASLFRANIFAAAASLLLYSFVIEIAQSYMGRTFSLLDLLANGVGIAAAVLAIVIAKRCFFFLGGR
jgi:VanZ family protein